MYLFREATVKSRPRIPPVGSSSTLFTNGYRINGRGCSQFKNLNEKMASNEAPIYIAILPFSGLSVRNG
jgi:hypothetical protein